MKCVLFGVQKQTQEFSKKFSELCFFSHSKQTQSRTSTKHKHTNFEIYFLKPFLFFFSSTQTKATPLAQKRNPLSRKKETTPSSLYFSMIMACHKWVEDEDLKVPEEENAGLHTPPRPSSPPYHSMGIYNPEKEALHFILNDLKVECIQYKKPFEFLPGSSEPLPRKDIEISFDFTTWGNPTNDKLKETLRKLQNEKPVLFQKAIQPLTNEWKMEALEKNLQGFDRCYVEEMETYEREIYQKTRVDRLAKLKKTHDQRMHAIDRVHKKFKKEIKRLKKN